MSDIEIIRTPEIVAAEINSIKEQTQNILLFNSIEIGRRLTEAKNMMEHGQFGKWLAEKVDYSQSTANNLTMQNPKRLGIWFILRLWRFWAYRPKNANSLLRIITPLN